jgi:hypothetical protein
VLDSLLKADAKRQPGRQLPSFFPGMVKRRELRNKLHALDRVIAKIMNISGLGEDRTNFIATACQACSSGEHAKGAELLHREADTRRNIRFPPFADVPSQRSVNDPLRTLHRVAPVNALTACSTQKADQLLSRQVCVF